MGYGDRSGSDLPVCTTKLGESGKVHAVLFLERGEVIVGQPESWSVRIPSQEHDASPGDTPELSKRPRSLVPVMNSQYGHDDISASITKRKTCGAGLYGWRRGRRPLTNHRHGRLDRRDASAGGFIGACTRSNIDNGAIDSKDIVDRLTDPWILNPLSFISNAYGVVEQKRGPRFTWLAIRNARPEVVRHLCDFGPNTDRPYTTDRYEGNRGTSVEDRSWRGAACRYAAVRYVWSRPHRDPIQPLTNGRSRAEAHVGTGAA